MALAHCKKLELAPKAIPVREFHKVSARVRARAQDEDNGGELCALLINNIKTDHRRLNISVKKDLKNVSKSMFPYFCNEIQLCQISWTNETPLAHGDSDIVGDCSVDSVNTETTQQEQLLKVCQLVIIFHWQRSLFRRIKVIPL